MWIDGFPPEGFFWIREQKYKPSLWYVKEPTRAEYLEPQLVESRGGGLYLIFGSEEGEQLGWTPSQYWDQEVVEPPNEQ